MKKLIVWLSAIFATIAVAAAGDRFITNTNLDKDVIIEVNDGGTFKEAIKVEGSTSNVTLGPSSTNTYSGPSHIINGGLNAGGTGIAAQDRSILLNANAYNPNAYGRTRATGTTGAYINILNAVADTSETFTIAANKIADGATTSPATILSGSASGAWTFGPTGFAGTHTVNGSMSTTAILSASALQRVGANGVAFNESATINLFASGTNSAYIVNVGQQGASTPIALTCFIYIGSDVNAGTVNSIGSTSEMSCSVASGQVRVSNITGGAGSMTIRWGANTIY